jgi:hypothetical protein
MLLRFWKPYVRPEVWRSRSSIRIGSAVGFGKGQACAAAGIDADIPELGQDVRDRRVDRDLALLDQHHEGDRGDRLGHAGDAEQRALVDRFVRALARRALAAEMDDLAVAAEQDLGVGQLARVEVSLLQEAIDTVQPRGVEAVLFGRLDVHCVSFPPASSLDSSFAVFGSEHRRRERGAGSESVRYASIKPVRRSSRPQFSVPPQAKDCRTKTLTRAGLRSMKRQEPSREYGRCTGGVGVDRTLSLR